MDLNRIFKLKPSPERFHSKIIEDVEFKMKSPSVDAASELFFSESWNGAGAGLLCQSGAEGDIIIIIIIWHSS